MSEPVLVALPRLEALVRKPRESDQNYVASTWVESLCSADHSANRAGLGFLIDRMLDHDGISVLLACEPTRSSIILGWLCWSPVKSIRLVHYAYTRAGMRNRGVQTALMVEAKLDDSRPLVYTMKGPSFMWLTKKYPTSIEHPVKEFLA